VLIAPTLPSAIARSSSASAWSGCGSNPSAPWGVEHAQIGHRPVIALRNRGFIIGNCSRGIGLYPQPTFVEHPQKVLPRRATVIRQRQSGFPGQRKIALVLSQTRIFDWLRQGGRDQ